MLPRVESEIFKKVKLSLCLTKHHAMKAYRGSAGITPRIFGLGARWGEWSASRPGHFTPKERAPQYPCIGGWVGLTADLAVGRVG